MNPATHRGSLTPAVSSQRAGCMLLAHYGKGRSICHRTWTQNSIYPELGLHHGPGKKDTETLVPGGRGYLRTPRGDSGSVLLCTLLQH